MACIQRRTSIVKLKVRDILELLIYIVCNLYSKSKTRHVFVVISINAVPPPPSQTSCGRKITHSPVRLTQ